MCLIFSLLPMTFWLVMAYLVFYVARRSEGTHKAVGRALGLWIVGVAVCFLIMGAYVQFAGYCPLARRFAQMLAPGQPATVYGGQASGKPRRGY